MLIHYPQNESFFMRVSRLSEKLFGRFLHRPNRNDPDLKKELDAARAILERARILYLQLDKNGSIVKCSPNSARVIGRPGQDLQNYKIWELLHETREITFIKDALCTKAWGSFPKGFVNRIKPFNGEARVFVWTTDEMDEETGLISFFGRDITETCWAEALLERKDKRSKLILEQIPAVIWSVDKNLRVTTSVGGALGGLGFKSRQLEDVSLYEYVKTNDSEHPVIKRHLRALAGETVKAQTENNGRTLQTILEPLRDDDGGIRGAVGIAFDVTDLKMAERSAESLARQEAEARLEAERLSRVKDEFLITLSHELRTPLGPILGWIELLKSGSCDRENVNMAINVIERNAKAELQLIEDLLDTSRIMTGKLKLEVNAVALNSIVHATLDSFRLAANAKGISLSVDDRSDGLLVLGDEARLRQVFWNILGNAIKFTPQGGRIDIALEESPTSYKVVVKDSGIGIEESFIPFVFERFSQADSSLRRNATGLGLGLSLVKFLVEAHGGHISVSSAGRDRGASFVVELPKYMQATSITDQGVEALITGGEEVPGELHGLKVLIVEDLDDDRDTIVRLLNLHHAEVRAVSSVEEAFELMRVWKPDIIVSDIAMPEEDGLSFIKRLRSSKAEFADIPALALTAYASSDDKSRALKAGFHLHMAKPADSNKLIGAIASIARTHH